MERIHSSDRGSIHETLDRITPWHPKLRGKSKGLVRKLENNSRNRLTSRIPSAHILHLTTAVITFPRRLDNYDASALPACHNERGMSMKLIVRQTVGLHQNLEGGLPPLLQAATSSSTNPLPLPLPSLFLPSLSLSVLVQCMSTSVMLFFLSPPPQWDGTAPHKIAHRTQRPSSIRSFQDIYRWFLRQSFFFSFFFL